MTVSMILKVVGVYCGACFGDVHDAVAVFRRFSFCCAKREENLCSGVVAFSPPWSHNHGVDVAEAFLVGGLALEILGCDVEVFGADAEVLALAPDRLHEVAHGGFFSDAFGDGYDEADFSVFEVLEDFDVGAVFANPVLARDA